MNEEEAKRILSTLVRRGKVSDVDTTTHRVRVFFEEMNIVSGWLSVLRQGGEAWTPYINDHVLCLYLPMFNGDGFVLGVIT